MKNKKISFSILETIEKNNMEKEMVNLTNLYLQKKKNDEQLKLLIQYQKEYIEKMQKKMKSGIYIYEWQNDNNFISILQEVINNNLDTIKKNTKIIETSVKKFSKTYIKMKIWNYLNMRQKKRMLKIKKIHEQTLHDDYSQFEIFKKGL